jgi:hypothetical protein
VDLLKNPEQFTGYSGEPATKIWKAIYEENCFESKTEALSLSWKKCTERKVFYKIVSGLHASVSTHLTSKYFDSDKKIWRKDLSQFSSRVGQFKDRIQNLGFLYLQITRAIRIIIKRIINKDFRPENDIEGEVIKVIYIF